MRHLGDITKLNGAELPVVDVITGGSPCQDLSIAGRREGLAGERSGLFMDQIRIVKEMRAHDRQQGRTGAAVRPRYMVWENVPGAFSSNKGQDFRAVLEEIVRVAKDPPHIPDLPMPEKGRWTKSGCLYDELGRWSVAWRVHDAQHWGVPQRRKRIALVADFGGLSAPEILFERQGLSWDPDEGQPAGEETAAGAGGSSPSTIGFHLTQDPITSIEKTPCLSSGNPTTGQCSIAVAIHQNASGEVREGDVAYTIGTNANASGRNTPLVAAFMGGQGAKAGGLGYHEEVSPSLKSVPSGGNTVPTVYDARGNGDGQITPTITGDHENRVTDYTAVCLGFSSNYEVGNDIFPVLRSHESGGCSEHVMDRQTVRRLTPLECERLQGFPDGWTDIGEWTDSKGKKHKEADSPRYKALGNSIALPYWKVLLKRISAQYDRDATMGSLFDGIGGFPLCWEQINGKGSALWASEIEEFPIAVTKLRFPEDGSA